MNEKKIGKTIEGMKRGGREGWDDPKRLHLLRAIIIHLYYDLIRVVFRDGTIWHLPVPQFLENQLRVDFYKGLERSSHERDNTYFACPSCHTPRFYDSPCNGGCRKRTPGDYWRNRGREFQMKRKFMAMIDRGELPKDVREVVYVRARPKGASQ